MVSCKARARPGWAGPRPKLIPNPGFTPLHLAIRKCDLEIVKLLLKHNADPNSQDDIERTPLYFAIFKGNIEIVKELLINGAEVDKQTYGVTPFLNALNLERIDIAKILLKHGANIDAIINSSYWYGGCTSLHEAAGHGKLEKVLFLLNHNANINAVGVHKRTPLHVATMFGSAEVIQTLLLYGANANLKDENLLTAFQYVSVEEGLNIFLEYGTSLNINVRSQDRDTFENSLRSFIRMKNIRVGKMIVYHECFRN